MTLSISNLAWEPAQDEDVARALMKLGVSTIDVVPGKYFPSMKDAQEKDVIVVREQWAARGFEISGLQALLFGTSAFNVFGDQASRVGMLAHLEHVAQIGQRLGAKALVFGSPRNRDRGSLDDPAVEQMAVSFFRELAGIAMDHGVVFCLEPNPVPYGCNFMTTTLEAAEMVRKVDHPAIRMNLDAGAITMNAEDVAEVIASTSAVVGHMHLSDPDLLPLGRFPEEHRRFAAALRGRFDGVGAIEMKPSSTDAAKNLQGIVNAVQFVQDIYSL
jgi:sugar phosphate isomerase/epimerase